jgi:hypothetical protein
MNLKHYNGYWRIMLQTSESDSTGAVAASYDFMTKISFLERRGNVLTNWDINKSTRHYWHKGLNHDRKFHEP